MHSLSDTLSQTRGIGAARRWVKSAFQKISVACDDGLETFYQKNFFTPQDGARIAKDVWINNVITFKKAKPIPINT